MIGKALEGPVCDMKEINSKQMLNKSDNESEGGGISVEKMKEAQQQLSKLLTPEQTQQAMMVLHGLRAEATEKEKQAAVVSFKLKTFRVKYLILFIFFSRSKT